MKKNILILSLILTLSLLAGCYTKPKGVVVYKK